jgi:hypothetical protein
MFGDELRFEAAMAIARHLNRQFTEIALERLLRFSVPGVASRIGYRLMSDMTEVLGSSASRARSTNAWVNGFRRPFSPSKSSGF